MRRVTKRQILGSGLAAGGAFAVAALAHMVSPARRAAWREVVRSPVYADLSLLRHPRSARIIGARYLAALSGPSARRRLIGQIERKFVASLPPFPEPPVMLSEGEKRARLDRQIRADFASERIVIVDGWVFSETEAQLCVLACLARL